MRPEACGRQQVRGGRARVSRMRVRTCARSLQIVSKESNAELSWLLLLLKLCEYCCSEVETLSSILAPLDAFQVSHLLISELVFRVTDLGVSVLNQCFMIDGLFLQTHHVHKITRIIWILLLVSRSGSTYTIQYHIIYVDTDRSHMRTIKEVSWYLYSFWKSMASSRAQ